MNYKLREKEWSKVNFKYSVSQKSLDTRCLKTENRTHDNFVVFSSAKDSGTTISSCEVGHSWQCC